MKCSRRNWRLFRSSKMGKRMEGRNDSVAKDRPVQCVLSCQTNTGGPDKTALLERPP